LHAKHFGIYREFATNKSNGGYMSPEVSIEVSKKQNMGVFQRAKQTLGRVGLTASLMFGAGAVGSVGMDAVENVSAEAAPNPNDPAGYPYPSGVTYACGGPADWCYQGSMNRDGYDYSNCTDYIDWILENYMGVNLSGMGNGKDWVNSARAKGYRVDNTPEPGDIYSTGSSGYGHVGMVESVNSNGSVNTINYNGYSGKFFRTTGYYAPYADINGTGNHLNFNSNSSPSESSTATHGSQYYMNWDNDGTSEEKFSWGRDSDVALVGDWDGDGRDEFGLRRGNQYFFDYNNNGRQNRSFKVGRSTDEVFVGDWNGDGKDTLGLKRNNTYYIDRDGNGVMDKKIRWGRENDKIIVGDWDGDGKDDMGLRRGTKYYLDYNEDGRQNRSASWGRTTDKHIIGDWDRDGKDELGLWRSSNATFYFDYDNNGRANRKIGFGRSSDTPITGDFNEDGRDDVGVRRGNTYYSNLGISTVGSEKIIGFGRSSDKHFIGDWFGEW